jgi:hypothetical protein
MRSRSRIQAPALLALAVFLAGGVADGQSAPAGAAAPYTQPMTLTDAKLGAFFDAMDDFRALGSQSTGDPSRPEAFARALGASHQSDEILHKHGFGDVGEFQRVAYNAAMAYGVLQKGGKAAVNEELEKAKADQALAIEKMREQLSPEQVKMIQGQMDAALATAGKMQDVPEENLALMKKYGDRMAKLRGH